MVLPAHAGDEPTITVPNTEFPLDTDNNPMPILVVGSGFDQSKSYSVVVSVAEGEMFFNPSAGTVTASPGYPSNLATPAKLFGFSGTFANIAKILHSTRYNSGENETTVDLKISISETIPGADRLYFNPANGHYYLWVQTEDGISWFEAKEAAENETLFGLTGYLVTITSEEENEFISNYTSAEDIWIGAGRVDEFDQEQGAIWEWKTGPEAGTDFFSQATWQNLGGNYSSWDGPEPNGGWQQMTFNEEVCIDPASFTPNSAVDPAEFTEPETAPATAPESSSDEDSTGDPDGANESDNETPTAPEDPEPAQPDAAESEPMVSIQEEQCEIQQVQRYRYFESYAVTNWNGSVGQWNDLPGDPATDIGFLKVYNYLVEFGGTGAAGSIMRADKAVDLTISSTAQMPAEPDALGEIDEGGDEEGPDGEEESNTGDSDDSAAEGGASGSGKGWALPATGSSLGLTALITMLFALAMSATMMRDSFPKMDVVIDMFAKLRRPEPQPLYTGNIHPAWPTI